MTALAAGAPKGDVRLMPGLFRRTDSGNAERFAARYSGTFHYVQSRQKWLVWLGTHWGWDDHFLMDLRTKDMARGIAHEAHDCNDMKERQTLLEWASKSEGVGKRRACLDLVRAEPGVTITVDDLDKSPWLLNCTNGTLDLRTGELHTHRREDLITKCTDTAYVKDAGTFLWDDVLNNMIGGDKELGAYMQRVAGYALTGMATERAFFFLYGPPGSGKSTFIEALLSCMGGYAKATSFDTWLERPQVGGNRDDLVNLQGVRLVTSGEVSGTKHWDTSLIKKITGGDRITACAKFEKEVSFLPTCTLIFAANDSPKARDDDDGFWDRAQRVPITNVVPAEKRVKNLHALLREEDNREAILAWAVEGCRSWQANGIGTAAVVKASSARYRDENDWIAGFLDLYDQTEGATISATNFRDQYERYCKQEGQKPEATKTLARRIEKRTDGAVAYKKIRGVRLWSGLQLRGEPPAGQQHLPGLPHPEDEDDLVPPPGRFD